MKTKCKTCGLNSANLFFYSRFGTIMFVLFGLGIAFMATIDISGIEIMYYERFDNAYIIIFLAWVIYRTILRPASCEI